MTIIDRRVKPEDLRGWAEEILEELNEQALFMDGFDDAIVGVTCETEPRVVYSEERIIDMLMKEGCTEEEAWDHYGFNIQGSIQPNDHDYPIIIREPRVL